LYAVRDELVLLVAQEKVSETDKVFMHYYERVNNLLGYAPDIGIDNFIDNFLSLKKSGDFESQMKRASKNADEMQKLVEDCDKELALVVANFYDAAKEMILAHSSYSRILYLILFKQPITAAIEFVVGEKQAHRIKVMQFAEEESREFHRISLTTA
jgi:hypothetical protein